jgi:hypothetical protein
VWALPVYRQLSTWRGLAGVVAAACVAGCGAAANSQPVLISDPFTGPNGLVAAENHPPTADSPWVITSGSLFRDNDAGWTGRPDDGRSGGGTGSAVFRMVSVQRGLTDIDLTMRLRVDDLAETDRTPDEPFDGAHIWVRYKSEEQLYAVSVDRRDATMIIKKKCAEGNDNGGAYYDLSTFVTGAPIPFGRWQQISVTVRDMQDGSVEISANRDGRRVAAIDSGLGCSPLRGGGGVGLRGDNAELRFDDIRVVPVG